MRMSCVFRPHTIRTFTFVILVGLLLLSSSVVVMIPKQAEAASGWYVATTGSDSAAGDQSHPFKTIGKGISAAAAGDTVHVAAGTYSELINPKSGVVVQGAGQEVTIIDGGANGIAVVTTYNVDSTAVLSGFTVTNGGASGMANHNSSPTVTDCTFWANRAVYDGGGMWNNNSSPTLTNCIFRNNIAPTDGGGMSNRDSSSPIVTNCTFYGNSAASKDSGGGMYNLRSSPVITNCVMWGDTPDEIYNTDISSSPAVTYSDVDMKDASASPYSGTGNINADPLFVNAANGDFHLQTGSPCIDTGNNSAPSIPTKDFEGDSRILDGDGTGGAVVDMGVDEVPSTPPHVPPVPELPTIVLLGLAVGGLGGFVLYRRRQLSKAKTR